MASSIFNTVAIKHASLGPATPSQAGSGPRAGDRPLCSVATSNALCFVFIYLVLYSGPALASLVPGGAYLVGKYEIFLHWFVPWVGSHVLYLRFPIRIVPTSGSGDTSYDYVLALCHLVVGAVGTVVWSLLERGRPNEAGRPEWSKSRSTSRPLAERRRKLWQPAPVD